ncbi:zinc finger protein Xfin [Calliphora vicina]|uniref:zinc finger protein Xfin n=1 Tax=Calliphora vicina TaxID=7373 RepID=UPI00325BC3D1
MNEDDKISASVVNEPQQPSGINTCRKRNLLQLLRQSGTPATSMPTPLQVDTDEAGPQQQQLLNLSFKRDANTSKINAGKRNASPDNTEKSMCNMCCRKDEVCANLQHNHATVLTVSDITRLPSWDIRQILSAVCSRCLVYIGAITESSSKLRLRCEQAMHSQTVVIAPPTPDTSPNNFLQVTTTLLDDAADLTNNVQLQRNCYAPGYCDDAPNEISSSLPAPAPLVNQKYDATSRSPSPSIPGNDSMLRIHYERPVSPLTTESGGGGKHSKRSYQRVQVIPVQMICAHCNRAYWRKDYYRKHMRRCSAKYRYAKSLMTTRSRSTSRMELDAVSVVSEGNEQITTHHQPRTYRCNICTVTVESISKLRQHKRIHLPRYYCDICNSEYTSQNEYDFHRAQCMAKKEVFEKGLEDIRNEITSPQPMLARRKTRSFSRAQSVASSLAPSKTETTTKKVKTPAKRTKTPKKSVPEQIQNDDVQSTITNYVKRHQNLYTDEADEDFNKVIFEKHNDYKDLAGDDEDDEDDNVSEVDTLYSKRLSLTNHWVEEHSISSHSHLSQGDNYIDDYMDDITFRSIKEYDLYLLDRLKIEVRLNSLTCFVPDCRFTCATLNEMMVHDYIYHYKKPLFYCHKCGYCFTSKVFLDYHLDLQNKGRYVCYKCGGHFEYQHQLDRHLIQHNRLSRHGGEKYVCQFCNFKFLDEDKLMKHCHYENHDWNMTKRSIEIDHSMTISNKVPLKINKGRKNKKYKVKILKMTLKPMPTKRCIPMEKYRSHLPPHLRIPNRIGQVEFRYPTNPNCVGCL